MEDNQENNQELNNQEQAIPTEEETIKTFEELQALLEANRLPLETSTSTDTIQRLRAIVDLLSVKISYPKYVEEQTKQGVFRKPTGSYEVSLFPNYGNSEQDNLFVRSTFTNLLNRAIKLANTL